jgi:hypothetical protein
VTSTRKKQSLSDMRKSRPIVKDRSRGMCEVRIPGVCEGRATNYHHRLPEGQGGSSEPENLLHLCGDGVRGCHGHIEHNRAQAYEKGWLVHSWEDPAEVPWWRAE